MKKYYLEPLFPYVQAVSYHNTPENMLSKMKEQMEWYRDNFVNCSFLDLKNLLEHGEWKYDKPGLIISFDDGLRSNFNVALPLLEEYGFTGWFMVPSGWADLNISDQIKFAKRRLIEHSVGDDLEPIALSWEDMQQIELRGHVITCHTMNHRRLSNKLTTLDLENEIEDSKSLLEFKLGHGVDIFTWVGGEEWAYCKKAFEKILGAGFKYVFCTNCAPITGKQTPFFLQRYHVEPDHTKNQLRLTLGGFYDLLYLFKRKRIENELTKK